MRMVVRGHPGQIVWETLSPKIAREKWTGSVTQALEHLLCSNANLSPGFKPQSHQKRFSNFSNDVICKFEPRQPASAFTLCHDCN
jgi:hypothetical protein